MPKFFVHRPEIHYTTLEVEAENKQDAIAKAMEYTTDGKNEQDVDETEFFEFGYHILGKCRCCSSHVGDFMSAYYLIKVFLWLFFRGF